MVRISNKKGFTLIELLIVVAIIGLLAGVIVVSTSGANIKAQKSAFRKETKGNYAALANQCTTTGLAAAVTVPSDTKVTNWDAAFTTVCSSNGNFTINAVPVNVNIAGCVATVTESGVSYTAQCN